MPDKREEGRELDPDYVDNLESNDVYRENVRMFAETWLWTEKNINRTNRLKGWLSKERREGELIALIHSEVSEALEGLRHGNPKSEKIPEVSQAEEELADAIIRIMDMAYCAKWNIPKALFLKIEYNKTRPYRHGKKF